METRAVKRISSLPLWGRAGVGVAQCTVAAPIPTFPQRGNEQTR